MILECTDCHARYVVQIGLFAQGGRQVRCARCKHEWHATLPTSIDVFVSNHAPLAEPITEAPPVSPTTVSEQPVLKSTPSSSLRSSNINISAPTPNLPAVIRKWRLPRLNWPKLALPQWELFATIHRHFRMLLLGVPLLAILVIGLVMGKEAVPQIGPFLSGIYQSIDFLQAPVPGKGLVFEEVKSELRYDGGTMRLFVDGTIHNSTEEQQAVPTIIARALGPDSRVIQSWSVDMPAANLEAGAVIPFHTEVNTPMNQTIANVYLEFQGPEEKSQEEKDDAAK